MPEQLVHQVQTVGWCASARRALLHSIWQHTGYHSLRLRHDSIFVWLPVVNWQFCHIGGSHMVVGHTLSPVRRYGTHHRNIYATLSSSYSTSVFCSLLGTFLFSEALARLCSINPCFTFHYITSWHEWFMLTSLQRRQLVCPVSNYRVAQGKVEHINFMQDISG